MATVVVINPNQTDPYVRLLNALRNKREMLEQIGALLVGESERAFMISRFGAFRWKSRYPNQGDPFVNIAGLVSDLNRGASIKSRRFDRTPPLLDTSNLSNSIKDRLVKDDTVEVGTTVEYADAHQWGLVSTQKVTKEAKKALAKWLLKQERPMKKKLSFLLMPNMTQLDTEVVQRPFVGVTKRAENQIGVLVERGIGGAAGR